MREDAGSVSVSVSVMNGTVSQDIIVMLSMATGGTATGEVNKVYIHSPNCQLADALVLKGVLIM